MAENKFPNEFWHNEVEHTVCNVESGEIQYFDVTLTADSGYKFNNEDLPLLVSDGLYDYDEVSDGVKAQRFKYVNATTCQLLNLHKRDGLQSLSTYIRGTVVPDSGGGTGFPANFVVNIQHVKDNGSVFDSGTWKVALKCDDGWRFAEAPKVAYRNKYGQTGQDPLNLNEDGTQATKDIADVAEDTQLTFDGETTDQEPEPEPTFTITNNVPHTTATSDPVNPTNDKCVLTLTADDGYRIENANVQFMTKYGTRDDKDFDVASDGHTATCEIGDAEFADLTTGVTISGTSKSETPPELTVTNNIAGTTEKHTFDGVVATFEVTGKGEANRFINPSVNYTSTDGTKKTVSMDVEVMQYDSVARATVNDIDPAEPVTLTGTFERVVFIYSDITNCTFETTPPEYIQQGETLQVKLVANPNTEFDTAPYFDILAVYPTTQPLTVSEDKRTATGSVKVGDWQHINIKGNATPVAVVGTQYGAINVYLVTLDELAEFSEKRFFKLTDTDPSTGAPQYENVDLGAYVNRIRRIYTDIAALSTDVIQCGNYNTGVSCQQPAQDKITLDFGTAVVPAHNEDNTDYESEIQIFLPFAGFVSLPSDYAGKTISLQYVINVVTGNGVALLSCNGVVFQVVETEPSSEIIYLSPSTQVKTVGGDDWNEMLYYGLEPYIYCKWYESASNGRNNDRQTGILGDFRGFNVFDDVTPIHTAEMLTEEQEMIYTALSDGVYIE